MLGFIDLWRFTVRLFHGLTIVADTYTWRWWYKGFFNKQILGVIDLMLTLIRFQACETTRFHLDVHEKEILCVL